MNKTLKQLKQNTEATETKTNLLQRFQSWCQSNLLIVSYMSLIVGAFIGATRWTYLFIYIPLYGAFLVWVHWDKYTMGLEMVERQLWGAPLSYYKDKGIPRPKLKFVLNKKKYMEKQKQWESSNK